MSHGLEWISVDNTAHDDDVWPIARTLCRLFPRLDLSDLDEDAEDEGWQDVVKFVKGMQEGAALQRERDAARGRA